MFNLKSQLSPNSFYLKNVKALTPEGWQTLDSLCVCDGVIQPFDTQPSPDWSVFDGEGRFLCPGIVDIHGDAFERHITPRAGTVLPLDLALAANDQALLGAGITTFFYSITDGFEPGPRSRATVRTLLNKLDELRPRLRCNTYIHIRHETVNTEDHDELKQWLRDGRVDLLSLNDHLPDLNNPKKVQRYLNGLNRRVSMTSDESDRFLEDLQHRRPLGEKQVEELVALAHECEIPLASHDDMTEEDLALSQQREVAISEFPMTYELADAARKGGSAVVMGAPNLLRGGSHVGGMSVEQAVKEDVVDVLCSDYHYPSLFRAPLELVEKGLLSFEEAWRLVSEKPASAAGLGQRKGQIAPGYDADFLLLDSLDGSPLSIRSVVCEGHLVLQRLD